ncbi:Major Facilitator Superfamily protein [Lentzea albidocapillata subsp. violacea]|uniref:Major Facilitator Superfamily protein n=1 Tax=Lentzea albidocapillata subsp. violacea TaxID=128104 RepID=A0A1G9TRC6_9PSEU|nr:MFS transporter [Lentzea albidocapillata]SDM50297.1 Major Facilitator Superfamily protein [Lentzea albidocapillata subsp. violacea]
MPRSLTPLLAALLVMYSVHQMLTGVIAPLAGELALTAFQLSLVFTVTSVTITVTSLLWGLLFDAVGPRPVLFAGLVLCVAGPAGFAATVAFGLDETLTPNLAFAFVLLFRAVLFGAGLASVLVAALAVAGLSTQSETARTRAIGFVGAAQSLGAVIGPVAGGALAVASMWLPLYVAPGVALLLSLLVLATLKPLAPQPGEPVQVQPLLLVPAFGTGFFLYLSLGMAQVVVVYLAVDKLRMAAGAVEGVLFASAIGLVLTQGLLVPLLKWYPVRLMRIGSPVSVAGYALLAVAPSSSLMALAFLVVAVGVGLALTGFAAAASLGAGPRHQGLTAGLVTTTSGLTFIAAPMLSALLYEVEPVAPVLAAAVAALVATGLSYVPVTPQLPRPVA